MKNGQLEISNKNKCVVIGCVLAVTNTKFTYNRTGSTCSTITASGCKCYGVNVSSRRLEVKLGLCVVINWYFELKRNSFRGIFPLHGRGNRLSPRMTSGLLSRELSIDAGKQILLAFRMQTVDEI